MSFLDALSSLADLILPETSWNSNTWTSFLLSPKIFSNSSFVFCLNSGFFIEKFSKLNDLFIIPEFQNLSTPLEMPYCRIFAKPLSAKTITNPIFP